MKDSEYVKFNSINPLYLIIDKVDEYIEEKNANRYLIYASTEKIREVLTKYTKLGDKIKYLIETINDGEAGEYGKDFMKIKFDSDDNLLLNKISKLHNITIVIRSVFQKDDKYYPQGVLD